MPRIDPQQLLVCLTPLLASNGGIKSTQEVLRLASLMEKYSKKLVSKCIYIQILKCTETELIGQFMSMGGWNLTHNWLRDGAESSNWAFVQELLEMLLLCPVDGNRLKSNHTPKIVKNLSISCPHNSVRILSTRLVEQWLKIAHQEKQQLQGNGLPNGINGTAANHNNSNIILNNKLSVDDSSSVQNPHNNDDILNDSVTESSAPSVAKKNGLVSELNDDAFSKKSASENVKYKINKENSGGLLLTIKRSTSVEDKDLKIIKSSEHKSKSISTEKEKDATKKSSSSSSHKSSSSSSSKSSHRNKDRSSSRHRSSGKSSSSNSSSSSKDKHRSSSSSSSRDKDKDREKRKKDAEKSSQAEKDKETLNFLAPLPSTKLPKITKRQQSENGENKSSESNKDMSETSQIIKKPSEPVEKKKPSISIEVRKGDKPKTVKTINSQFRNHGLAEEPPPPPSRKDLKKPSQVPTCLPTSLPSSGALKVSTSPPPSKKIHLEKLLDSESSQTSERVGGVKLIKPKHNALRLIQNDSLAIKTIPPVLSINCC